KPEVPAAAEASPSAHFRVSNELSFANSGLDNCSKDHQYQGRNCDSGSAEPNFSDGDMDIGVDLTLDESGVLESEPLGQNVDQGIPDKVVLAAESAALRSDSEEAKRALKMEDSLPLESAKGEVGSTISEDNERHKHGGKRVTFPSDEDIVSGAVEPKDPWRHGKDFTNLKLLLLMFRRGWKLPLSCVKLQSTEFKELTQRNDCLDLKGEKLDYKACESLEEIFKRVQFRVVDLEQTNLDEDGASALFDMIEYYESATHLNISFNKHIGTRGWQAAAHMMRKTSSLQYLDARNTPLLDHSAPFVARALRISGSLAVLHLENAGLSGRPLMLLATALKMNMNLRELYLADNKLNGLQDSAQLGNLLKFNYNIQILDLRNNYIMDSGLAYLCDGLKEQRKGLVTLVLWNNQLTHNGMGYLAAALPCTQSLETLNLGHNSVGNEGIHKLKDGLIANRSVLRLGLACTKLSCEGAVAVAEFIAESPRLLRLDLRENEIKTGGLMALSLALKVNTSLLRLDLDREPKKETVKSFIETQRNLLTEIQNGCKHNFILAKEKEETEQKMRLSASMPEITSGEDERGEDEEVAAGIEPSTEDDDISRDKVTVNTAEQDEESEDVTELPGDGEKGKEGKNSPESVESDSDTDEEDVEDTRELGCQAAQQHSAPCVTRESQPAVNRPHSGERTPLPSTLPSPTLTASGITVTESPVSPGVPSSPGRCISVSSPGRGHKIFMVTRVESPPERQQHIQPPQAQSQLQQGVLHPSAMWAGEKQQHVEQEQHMKVGTVEPVQLPQPASPQLFQTAAVGAEEEQLQPKTPLIQSEQMCQMLEATQKTGVTQQPSPVIQAQEHTLVPPMVTCSTAGPEGYRLWKQPDRTPEVVQEANASDVHSREVTLPNGLRPEFALCLPVTEAPKLGSCVAGHGECPTFTLTWFNLKRSSHNQQHGDLLKISYFFFVPFFSVASECNCRPELWSGLGGAAPGGQSGNGEGGTLITLG
uniref:Protein phosphatase 1 regulatory subunit 37 n=1 Tax=Scleropages formosus TaxID=113540 RepID=A0A8C9VQ89_SCLFO